MKKTIYSRQNGGSMKFLLSCDSTNTADWLEVQGYLVEKQFNVLLGSIKGAKVVIKFGSASDIQKEYSFSKLAYHHKCPNFIKFLCSFTCDDSETEIKHRDFYVHRTICKGPGDQLGLIVMPFYPMGNLNNYRWTRESFHVLKAVVKQTVFAALYAHQEFGFVHGDLHPGNVILCTTKKESITYGSHGALPTFGMYTIVMDFGRSYLQTDVTADIYRQIDRLLHCIQNMDGSDLVVRVDQTPLTRLLLESRPIDNDVYSTLSTVIDSIEIRYAHSEVGSPNRGA